MRSRKRACIAVHISISQFAAVARITCSSFPVPDGVDDAHFGVLAGNIKNFGGGSVVVEAPAVPGLICQLHISPCTTLLCMQGGDDSAEQANREDENAEHKGAETGDRCPAPPMRALAEHGSKLCGRQGVEEEKEYGLWGE